MDVTFTKDSGRRYLVTIERDRGPRLAPRHCPGYHDYLPHDAVHFLVEAEARLAGGVFGRLAAGQSNLFWPADNRMTRHRNRKEAKRKTIAAERTQMGRSEDLAGVCRPLWELRAGHRAQLPDWFGQVPAEVIESPQTERIIARLDEFAVRWHPLPVGHGITLTWPLDARGRPLRPPPASTPPACTPAA